MSAPASSILWVNGSILASLLEDVPSTIEFDATGVAGASLHYQVDWRYAPALVAALTTHPDFPWLVRKSATINREEGFLARVAVMFQGVAPPPTGGTEDGRPEYSLEGSTSSEPIETHPNFDTFAGKPTAPVNGATFEKVDDGTIADAAHPASTDVGYRFKEFAVVNPLPAHPKAGVKSFENKGIIYTQTRTYSHTNINTISLNMNKLGEIDSPPSSSILPTLAAGRDWILASCSVVKVGNGMKVTRTWKLSGPKGWDPNIYTI